MRLSCLIVILVAIFTPIKAHATEQILNKIIYDGKIYSLDMLLFPTDDILLPYLKKNDKWEWIGDPTMLCTALGRGYYTTFEIVNNELILKDIRNCSESLLEKFLSELEIKDSAFKADWFTDSILIGIGNILYDQLNGGIYEYFSILHFEKGILIKDIRMGYKEYVNNKWRKLLENLDDEATRNYLGDDGVALFKETFEMEYQSILKYMENYIKTRNETEAKLKIEYEKRFKEPISNFELTITHINFYKNAQISLERTMNGAKARFNNYDTKEHFALDLNMEEWLDFLRTLHLCRTDKWQKKYDKWTWEEHEKRWELYIKFSSKDVNESAGFKVYPPNWNEFKKLMNAMEAKLRKLP